MRGALILLLFAIGGPFLAWQGYQHRQFRDKLATDGVTVSAEAHGGQMRRGRRSSSARLDVSYDAGGRVIRKEMPVSTSFLKSISSGDSLTVDTVQLTYLKADPEQAIIVGGTPDTRWNLWIGLVLAVIGWVGGGMYVAGKFADGASGEPAKKSSGKKSGKMRPRPVDDDE